MSNMPNMQIETLEAFAKRTGQTSQTVKPKPRVKLSDIRFPAQTGNMSALRFSLRVIDALFVTAVILISVWSGYIGTNNNGALAPLAAGLSGALGFLAAMYLVKAHHFSPAESYSGHMKRVLLGAAAALGVWLSTALIFKPVTFIPDALLFLDLWPRRHCWFCTLSIMS